MQLPAGIASVDIPFLLRDHSLNNSVHPVMIEEAVKVLYTVQAETMRNLEDAVQIIQRLEKRITNLEQQRDVAINRVMKVEEDLTILTTKFDAHLELYHV